MNHLLVEEDETARLLALQWSVASVLEPDKMRRARDAGTFFEGDGQSELPLQSMLSDIVHGYKSEVALKLVVP
jgi:hypothetical protein